MIEIALGLNLIQIVLLLGILRAVTRRPDFAGAGRLVRAQRASRVSAAPSSTEGPSCS